MKKQWILILTALLFAVALCGSASAADISNSTKDQTNSLNTADTPPSSNSDVNSQLINTDIPFIENQGQNDPSVKYYADTFYGTASVTSEGITHTIQNQDNQSITVTEQFLDENGNVITLNPQGEEQSQTHVSYFTGNDPGQWQTNLTTWNLINLGEIYPNITVKLKAHGGNVEKLFFVSPGGNPDDIKILVSGVDGLSIDSEGRLVLESASFGNITMTKPTSYQENQNINTNYTTNGNTYGYKTANYDHNQQLTIDPVLQYSTYLGGASSDWGLAITVDNDGNAYITGGTASINFPLKDPLQNTNHGSLDVFVTKINPQGALVYSTYLGGTETDEGNGIAVDSEGNVYLTGHTYSTDFPLQNPLQNTKYCYEDAFVTKINPTGTALIYSTYLGGNNRDSGNGIAVDSSGNAYITGTTFSTDFPLQNPLQNTNQGYSDAFVTKINASGTVLVYSTYLGGTDEDKSGGIAVDMAGDVYITGTTWSADFPLQNPLQNTNQGYSDAFVTKINPTGTALTYSTYLGGTDTDQGSGIAVDSNGNAYITGTTVSTDFPLQNPLQTYQGNSDAFATKINPTGTALTYSTYLGGTNIDQGSGIAVDRAGNIYITGTTASTDFPLQNPLQITNHGYLDAFVTKINPTGTALTYSTYLGGTNNDTSYGIAVDRAGNAYITGYTWSTDFPLQNPIQTYQDNQDGFVAKIAAEVGTNMVTDINTGNTFNTIEEAINDATTLNGHTLEVSEGNYSENVVVNKILTIIPVLGDLVTVQALNTNLPVFNINALGTGSTIQGFNITGASGSYGIYLDSTNNCSILGNDINGNSVGIGALNTSGGTISGNVLGANSSYGLLLDGSSNNTITGNSVFQNGTAGIFASTVYGSSYSESNTFTGNLIIGNGDGMEFYGSSFNTVSGNTITGNTDEGIHANGAYFNQIVGNLQISSNEVAGIYMDFITAYNTISGNTINSNSVGVYTITPSGNTITNNNISDNTAYGIIMDGSSNNTITGNTITGSGFAGIFASTVYSSSYSNYNNISNNQINSNGEGLELYGSSYNTISGNTINNNIQNGIHTNGAYLNQITGNQISGNGGIGIFLDNFSAYNLIYGNNLSSNSVGVYTLNASFNTISGNIIQTNTSHGMILDGSSTNNVSGNYIANNGLAGVFASTILGSTASNSNTIAYNLIVSNGSDGVELYGSNFNNITANTITNNIQNGIYTNGAYFNQIINNLQISSNGASGLYMENFSDYNNIDGNNLTGNASYGLGLNNANNNTITGNNLTLNVLGSRNIVGSVGNVFSGNTPPP
jgi:parallel beta-helix repeat protein